METGPSGRPVVEWMEDLTLYSRDEEKIGHIDEVNPQFFVVSKGLLGREQLYLPRTGDERREEDRVYVNLTKDEIESGDWSQRPGGDAGGVQEREYQGGGMPRGDAGYESAAGTAADRSDETARIPRYEERVQADKSAQQVGEVRVGKDVVEERQEFDVPVMREEVEVRRRPVDRADDEGGAAFQAGDAIRVPVTEEQVEVRKEPRVVEEIEVQKVARQDTQRVSEPVRKEQFDVDEEGRSRTDRK